MQISPSTMNIGLQGIQRANKGMQGAAADIVQQSNHIAERGASQLAAPLLAMKTNALLFEASGKVIAASRENSGHLIDILV